METKNKITDTVKATSIVEGWKSDGDKVVFTNGCFDLIHLGHIDYLEKARQLGQKLVVGLNTDSSVSRIKGQGRPVTDENNRARVLAALSFIDLVVLFDEDTPYELIRELTPDILVKGNDYLAENIVGSDIVIENGGEVKTIELVKGYSTTSIINKIRE